MISDFTQQRNKSILTWTVFMFITCIIWIRFIFLRCHFQYW
jgi:hypothetical protein